MAEATEIKPEEMSYEQLEQAANQAVAEEAKAAPTRDEQGRFVAQEEIPQDTPPVADSTAPPAEKVVYQKVIDLGDGSGSQVFEADSMEELVDKLADAQAHASKKIREMAQERRAEKVTAAAPTDDEEWLMAQELQSKPKQTLDRLFEQYISKREQQQQEAFAREKQIGETFLAKHPDFVTNERNARKIERALELNGLERNLENLEKVYAELSADGLLALKDASTSDTDDTATKTSRIASSGAKVVPVSSRAASGISSKRSAAPAPKPQGPTVQELYDMPLEKLEQLALQADQQQ